uniref:ATP-dependent DNA helicase n=1 Tax=Panagrolaimus sp. PS1159 TaxID=55785 RepID=A0AC35F0W0_9BILA
DDFAQNMSEENAIKKAYREVQRILEIENKSLSDFPTMPQNVDFDEDYDIYDPIHDQQIGDKMFDSMNNPQKDVVEKIKGASSGENEHKLFYLDGPGGSGKTYTYTTLWHLLRASGKKVATMAYTGIAAILLPEGKTCHKTLGLTVPLYSDSNSTITPNSNQGKKLLETDVFIWDE